MATIVKNLEMQRAEDGLLGSPFQMTPTEKRKSELWISHPHLNYHDYSEYNPPPICAA